jgi:periplasmic divalent cation tolerance protein
MYLIYCPCPNQKVAKELAQGLLAQGLAVCVTILPSITSLYLWQGKIVEEGEALMVIKTLKAEAVSTYLTQHHPYDIPAIITIPVGVNDAFKRWAEGL